MPPNNSQNNDDLIYSQNHKVSQQKSQEDNDLSGSESEYSNNGNTIEEERKDKENKLELSDSDDSDKSSDNRLVIVSDDEIEDQEVKQVLSSHTPTISESFEKDIGKAVAKKILEKARFLKNNKGKEDESEKPGAKAMKEKPKKPETTKRNTRKTSKR